MPGGNGRVLAAMTRFEALRRARWRPYGFVVGLYVVFVLVGYRTGSAGWVGEAGFALLGFTLYAGFGVDRELAYEELVTSNWVGPWSYVGVKLLALTLALLAGSVVVGSTVWIGSAGAWEAAGWYALLFLLLGAYFLPLVLFVELEMESRLPMVGAVFLLGIVWLVVATVGGPDAGRELFLGRVPEAPRIDTLGPLAVRALGVALPAAAAIVPLVRRRVAGASR